MHQHVVAHRPSSRGLTQVILSQIELNLLPHQQLSLVLSRFSLAGILLDFIAMFNNYLFFLYVQ